MDVGVKKISAQNYLSTYPISGEPMELINGEIITMPSPFKRHSSVVSQIMWILLAHIKPQNLGEVLTEPTDVHFDEFNVLQPDLLFIHHENRVCQEGEDGYLHGAPDLVVEVLSKSTAKIDRIDKFEIYEKYGVREYWLVDPEIKIIELYIHEEGHFQRRGAYAEGGAFNSGVLPELRVNLSEIFNREPES